MNKQQFKQIYTKITPKSIALGILLVPWIIVVLPLILAFEYLVRGIQAEYYGDH